MQHLYRFIISIFTINCLVSSQFTNMGCQTTSTFIAKSKSQHEANTSFLNYTWLDSSYDNFIKLYQKQMTISVSDSEQLTFQNLYNPPVVTPTYPNFQQLVTTLTSIPMGTHTAAMNWTKLYLALNLSGAALANVEADQLRFYNIIAAVYGSQFVNHLVQAVNLANFTDGALGDTVYYQNQAAQRIRFGTDFTNQSVLNRNYNLGQFAGTDANYVVEHEYGHAFCNYVKTPVSGRAEFNETWVSNQTSLRNIHAIVTDDCTQVLLNYLNQRGNQFASNNNLTDYYYPSYQNNSALFPLILLPSNYSRVWFISNKPALKEEYFAEAFAFWLSTPATERGWNWGLFNDFFMNVFPQYTSK